MKLSEMRDMSTDELLEELAEAKEEQFNLRFQVATNQLDNTARIQEVKKNVARLLTVMREREIVSASTGKAPEAETEESA
jgi:large subunit ribosomal protein L29